MTDKGIGLLCAEFDHELAAEIEAQRTPGEREARAKAVAEMEAGDKFVRDAIEQYVEAECRRIDAERLQPELDAIDKMLAPHLKNELAVENAATRISPKAKQDFARFQKCAARWELPPCPRHHKQSRFSSLRKQSVAQPMLPASYVASLRFTRPWASATRASTSSCEPWSAWSATRNNLKKEMNNYE